jgi:hypothetical protein
LKRAFIGWLRGEPEGQQEGNLSQDLMNRTGEVDRGSKGLGLDLDAGSGSGALAGSGGAGRLTIALFRSKTAGRFMVVVGIVLETVNLRNRMLRHKGFL